MEKEKKVKQPKEQDRLVIYASFEEAVKVLVQEIQTEQKKESNRKKK